MSIGSINYPQPVQVNGFTCHNCTEVDEAKKHIDPAHPKSGPYGIDAASDPTNPKNFIRRQPERNADRDDIHRPNRRPDGRYPGVVRTPC
jgi:hypothetical protein